MGTFCAAEEASTTIARQTERWARVLRPQLRDQTRKCAPTVPGIPSRFIFFLREEALLKFLQQAGRVKALAYAARNSYWPSTTRLSPTLQVALFRRVKAGSSLAPYREPLPNRYRDSHRSARCEQRTEDPGPTRGRSDRSERSDNRLA
jgi:hypothetical protein